MLKSTLLEILRTFSKQELIKFEDFVRSPYFNKKENVLKLFLDIKKYSPELTDEALKKEKVWNRLFPGQIYNYGIMKNLIFDLSKLSEKFITNIRFNSDEFKKDEYLANELLRRELQSIYINKFSKIDSEPDLQYLSENNLGINDYLNYKSKLFEINWSFQVNFDQGSRSEKDLQNSHDLYQLTGFLLFLFEAYRIAVINNLDKNLDNDNNTVTKVLELILPGIEIIIQSVNQNSKTNSVYLNIYFLMYLALKENTESRYLDFKKIVFDNLNILPKFTLQNIHLSLLTVFAKLNNTDKNLIEVIDIYDSLIENNLITERNTGIVPIHIFNNYISGCFYLSDPVKIENFANRFLNKLDPKHMENSKKYVKFMISFLNKDFDSALMCISLIDVTYPMQKITLKSQKAMCLYEIGDYEMFLNEFDNMKHFVKNNSFITDEFNKRFNLLFTVIKSLFNLKQNFDNYEYIKLREIINANYRKSKPWFVEKLDKIEKDNLKKLTINS